MPEEFRAKLTARGPNGAWTFLPIPLDVQETFGTKGRVAVSGTMNGFPFQNSLMPEGDGTHVMTVSKDLKAGANAETGDVVTVVLERDVAERVVDVPEALSKALASVDGARTAFDRLAPSHRKEFADWVGAAKKDETRVTRASKSVEMILAGKRRG